MSDSRQDSGDQERPARNDRGGERTQRSDRGSSSARSGQGTRGGSQRNGERRPYGDRGGKPAGDRDGKRSYGDRDQKRSYGDRDQKRSYGDRDAKRPYGDRDQKRPYGDRDAKRPYGDRDQKRPHGDRDQKRPYGDRDQKRPYGDRDQKRSYGDRDAKRPYGDRDQKRSYGDRDAKRPYGDRDQKRSYGDRDQKRPYGDRDQKRSYGDRDQKRPYGERSGAGRRTDDRRGGRPDTRGGHHDVPRETHGAADRAVRPRHDDPMLPDRIEARQLDKGARAELKTLSKDNADWVARHMVAASEYLDSDPELAHQHALSAARRGGRIAVVRETLAITAYATGDFALALRELRTYRRISGSNDQLPLMVDSERGVGRPDRALEVGRSVDRAELPAAVQVGLAIAMSGARLDLEQPELALAELEIPQLDPDRAFSYSPALFSAYAEVLEELGRGPEAAAWRARADRADEVLNPPTESELVEIFEVELDGEADEVDETTESEPGAGESVASDVAASDESQEASDAADAGDAASGSDDATRDDLPEDFGAVLEEDVAAVLAEGEALERGETLETGDAEVADAAADTDEDGARGPVPSED
ncbi:primosomal protein [Agromyces mariniharenae]|uniref:Primosomal protein n=1 Tax=Agromyces mariniharenae TaxID=2604423 RepID=A0A5S4V0C7_9MICO|nr:primosomal protein [Agromyces mariniharenae]TYL51203.1 primosomal protein [Agromyces mariniharenae]